MWPYSSPACLLIFLIIVFTADLHFTPNFTIGQLLTIFVAIYNWSMMLAIFQYFANNGHFGPNVYGHKYGQQLTYYESRGKKQISSENNIKKYK